MDNFRGIDRQTGYLLPPSVDEWLPERRLARFIVEVIDGLDLRGMSGAYRGSGSASYHPRMLLGLLVYGYATGVFSSRKLERATYDSVAFRFIAANDHPDHDTIAAFRRRFLKDIEKLTAPSRDLVRMDIELLGGLKFEVQHPASGFHCRTLPWEFEIRGMRASNSKSSASRSVYGPSRIFTSSGGMVEFVRASRRTRQEGKTT